VTGVSIIAAGMAKFGRFPDRPLTDIGVEAVRAALADAEDFDPALIQAAYVGTQWGGSMIGQRILLQTGLLGIPIVNVENACSSGASGLREAFIAVRAGMYDAVLALGCDKLSHTGGTLTRHPDDYDGSLGLSPPALYALRLRRYLHDYNVSVADVAGVCVKNRRHALHNEHALFRKELTLDEVLNSRPVADPLTLLQCCARSDGAAAVVVASDRIAAKFGKRAIRIRCSELASGRYRPGFRDMTTPEITLRTAKQAYEAAGVGPDDIDLAEVHDAFSIAEILYYESLGFCGQGEGTQFLARGDASIGGRIPVNPSGGLMAKGHPPGATGLAQIVEAVTQLRGEAGPRQVENARIALTHCTGGGVSGLDHGACTIHILAN
jgi:benzoylsuccinyl-CoA thiolase BbsB subunit